MDHVVEGIVVEGDHRGRTLGFPTANILPEQPVPLPDDGVYAGHVERADGTVHVAAISVGLRPTYYGDDAAHLVEAYLLDFDGDLYGERMKVTLDTLVRGQKRFESTEALVAQIKNDATVRSLLGSQPLE